MTKRPTKRKNKDSTLENATSKVPKTNYPFIEVPIDCIRSICSFLEVKDLHSFSITCSMFRTCIISTVDNTYNNETIHSFYGHLLYDALQIPQNVVSNLKLLEYMKGKLERELQRARFAHFSAMAMNNPILSHCIHEISNWKFEKIDGKQTYVCIEFDWTRKQKTSHFHFICYGSTDNIGDYDLIMYVRCVDDPSTEVPFFIVRDCSEDDPRFVHVAPELLYDTTAEAAEHVMLYLDLKMDHIEFIHALFQLCRVEPYESSHSDSIEKSIGGDIWIQVRKFNFHPESAEIINDNILSEGESSEGSENY